MTIQISDHAEGFVVRVRAHPGARRNGIVGAQSGALKVAVTAPPDKGRANDSIVLVLADSLRLKRSQVELIGGATSRTLLVADDPDAVLRRAIQAGATEKSAAGDEHGWHVGRVVDPFGHEWEIGKPIGPWPPA